MGSGVTKKRRRKSVLENEWWNDNQAAGSVLERESYASPFVDDFYTPEEIATKLKIERDTVYEWVRAKQLWPAQKLNRFWRVPRQSIESFLNHKQGVSECRR